MASSSKKPPGDEGAPTPTRPARLRVMRPEVEEVLRSPSRGRPKLQQHKEGGGDEGAAAEDEDGAAPPRYDCAFQDEKEGRGGFAPPAMVWCKVRSHPWWPAQVFDAADASELALRHARSGGGGGHTLVAYFWDNTFAWTDPSALLPFRAHFARLAAQNTVYSYLTSVDVALEEVERRVEAGLSCACTFAAGVAKKQEVKNSGIREGAYGAVVDDAYMRDTFRGEPFLEYISALAASPLAGADRLDLATAKAQLRSFNRMRVPRELPEFVIYGGIEDVPTEARKRKKMETSGEEDVTPSKEKKPRRGESSLRKRDAANEEAVDEDTSVPRKSSARKKASKDVDKGEPPAKKDAVVEDSSVPSSKQSKSKRSKGSADKKKKKDSSRDIDNAESSLAEPAEEDATNEDSSMPTGEAIDGALSKGGKSKISKSSAKKKKKEISKDADKKESLPESAKEDATGDDSSIPGATDGALSKKRKSSRSSAKKKKQETSKDADKEESLPEPAKEEAMGDDSSMPVATDGTLSKKRKSSRSSAKKKKKDTSKGTDGAATVAGSKTPVTKAVDGTLSESKSGRRLRSTNKTEDASEGLKGPKKNGASETTKGEDKDAALLKANNLGRRASSARQKDKNTDDGDRLAGSSVKDPVTPAKKKSQVDETSVTKDSPSLISEHGRKKKKLSELLVETDTPSRSLGGKSKARRKRALNVSTEEPDRDTEDTVKTRGKRSLPASVETDTPNRSLGGKSKARRKRALNVSIEEPDRDTEDTVKARGKRSLPASVEKPEDPDRDMKDTKKSRGKRSLPKSTEEPEDPDHDTKDTMKTMKRKKLDTLGDLSSQPPLSPKGSTKGREATPKAAGKKSQTSALVKANGDTLEDSSSQPQPLSPKRSRKAREATRKAAELKPHTSSVVKANGEASQTRSRRTKNSEDTVPDKSPRSVKPNKGKKGATAEDSLSCGEMHSQLCLAASDLKKVGKITTASVGFFTEFSKSSCPSSSDVEKEIPIEAVNTDSYASSLHANDEKPEEAAEKVSSPRSNNETAEEAAEKVVSPHADEETAEEAAEKVASPQAKMETPEEAAEKVASPQANEAAEKVSSPHADKETAEEAAEKAGSPQADEETAEEAAEKVACPEANKETPEETAEKVAGPEANKETPEEAAEKVASPESNKETPEEAAEKVASPPAKEVTPEKVKNSEPSPSEPAVADHMKDDYWADILINVEEPISRLKRKKDKSKSKTSETKEPQAEAVPTKEPPVSAGNMEVEEVNKKAESKEDDTENGQAEEKPLAVAANGSQPNAEESATENSSLSGLVLHFSRGDAVPSQSDLIKIFSQYGPVSEARTEIGDSVSSAQVVFKRRTDAEAAFGGSGKMTGMLGPALVSFRLTDFPSVGGGAASGNGAGQGTLE